MINVTQIKQCPLCPLAKPINYEDFGLASCSSFGAMLGCWSTMVYLCPSHGKWPKRRPRRVESFGLTWLGCTAMLSSPTLFWHGNLARYGYFFLRKLTHREIFTHRRFDTEGFFLTKKALHRRTTNRFFFACKSFYTEKFCTKAPSKFKLAVIFWEKTIGRRLREPIGSQKNRVLK